MSGEVIRPSVRTRMGAVSFARALRDDVDLAVANGRLVRHAIVLSDFDAYGDDGCVWVIGSRWNAELSEFFAEASRRARGVDGECGRAVAVELDGMIFVGMSHRDMPWTGFSRSRSSEWKKVERGSLPDSAREFIEAGR